MALVELYHVVADIYNVDSASSIIEGNIVMQNSIGDIILATGAVDKWALGIAGDNKINTGNASGLPGARAGWQNRVSDPHMDETAASGMITVYHSGGKFATDQYDTTVLDFAVGDPLYSTGVGLFTNVPSNNTQVIGYCVAVPGPFQSGVPGVDIRGSTSLGTYIQLKLSI